MYLAVPIGGRIQVLDHRAEPHSTRIQGAVFCDLDPVHDAKPVTPEEAHVAAPGVGIHLAVYGPAAMKAQEIEESTNERARRAHAARIGEHVHVKMGGVTRSHWHLSPTVDQDPVHEVA